MAPSPSRSIAFAKTTRPAVASTVPRERLFARLDGSPARRMAWISGPPGAGKTSLAASYIESRRMRSLWYQVDADDADIAAFFHYLAHAARKLEGARARELPVFSPADQSDIPAFARKFFRQLFSRAKSPVALVLDNLHALPVGSALFGALEEAVSQVPRQSCILVTSRSDPPVAYARFRVTGEMLCVGAEALRLDTTELADIARHRGHELPPEAAGQLQARTQGWAAGLVLMLEHSKLAGRLAEYPEEAPPREVFDYLAGEIFERFEPGVRAFLLRVACLPRMTPEVAAAVSGEPAAGRLLVSFALNNYFVSEARVEGGRVFQLHPLLRDFLLQRASMDLPEALAPAQLSRAASLLSEAGQVEDAVALYAKCRDWTGLARVVAAEAPALLAQGRTGTLGAWLELLPAATLESDPALQLALGDCRLHSSAREARRLYEQALEAFRARGNAPGALRACGRLLDAMLVEFDDLAPLDKWSGVLAALLVEGGEPDPEGRAAAGTLARALLLRDAGNPRLEAWIALSGHPLGRALRQLLEGELAAAGPQIDALRSNAPPGRIALDLGLAAALHRLLDGDAQGAQDAAREGLSRAEAEGLRGPAWWLRVIGAAGALANGDREAVRTELRALEAARTPLRRGDRALLHYLRAWLGLLEDDGDAAAREARAAVALASETGLPWLDALSRSTLARLLAAAGDRRGAQAELRAAAASAGGQSSDWLRYCVGLAAWDCALQAGDAAGAREALSAAFAIGRSRGLRAAPAWRPRDMAEACVFALREGIEPNHARSLAHGLRLVPRVPPLRVKDWPWPFEIATLGGFGVKRAGAALELSGKGAGRPTELLKVLIALGGQGVRADQIADALWPRVDADYALKSFTATLHRLRKAFGDDDALVLREGRLSLDPGLVRVDAWALEAVLAELDEVLRGTAGAAAVASSRALVDEALAAYRGPFLPDESEQPGFLVYREQCRTRLLRGIARAARAWETAGQAEPIVEAYARFIDADPVYELPYRNLMLAYQRAGDVGEARTVYERLRALLAARSQAQPSAETQSVYAALAAKPSG